MIIIDIEGLEKMSDKIIDVRFHGRGGQGVVTGSRLLAEAALLENKFVHAFPAFGPERAGAPISGFSRLSKEKFSTKTEIYEPDIVIVQDNTLLGQVKVLEGIQSNGFLIVNHTDKDQMFQKLGPIPDSITIGMVDASRIAMDHLGVNIANTALVGAMVKLSGIVEIENVI
ncbi:MAG: 2-oxoacid:acceptor oxidoreductase family protein, partial [Candidatus Hodarchaeales archaeon]